jgi:hypothetical protein
MLSEKADIKLQDINHIFKMLDWRHGSSHREFLPSKHETLSSNPRTTTKKKKRKRKMLSMREIYQKCLQW